MTVTFTLSSPPGSANSELRDMRELGGHMRFALENFVSYTESTNLWPAVTGVNPEISDALTAKLGDDVLAREGLDLTALTPPELSLLARAIAFKYGVLAEDASREPFRRLLALVHKVQDTR